MTFLKRSSKIERVCTLPEAIWVEGEEDSPAIHDVTLISGTLWVFGGSVLLKSTDGANWQNVAANLRSEGRFSVSSIIRHSDALRIFARNKNGIRCYRWDEWDREWKALFSVPTRFPRVFAAWTDRGVVMVGTEVDWMDKVCSASASGEHQTWHRSFPGVALHMQMTFSGIGLCAAWGINDTPADHTTSPSAVYSTTDGGVNWRLAATLETQLVAGSAVDQNTSLVGGTGGVLALVDHAGIRDLREEEGGNIEALDAKGPNQVAVLESDDAPPIQYILSRSGSGPWRRHEARFDEHVACTKFLGSGECLVCTRHVIYRCQFE